MARTQFAGTVALDAESLAADLRTTEEFRWSEAYSDYLCGGPWKSCMLWASGGENGDGLVTNYDFDQESATTEFGQRLPYLMALIRSTFDVEHLNFARLATMSDSVTILHRDLLELADVAEERRHSHRVHIPLVTGPSALFTEGDLVFRMEVGDVWFLDASRVHGAAVLSREPRTHLILDFTAGAAPMLERFARERGADGTVPASRRITREPMSEDRRGSLVDLTSIVTPENLRDVFSIVLKDHYRSDGGPDLVWDTMDEIGRLSGDDTIRAQIADMHKFFLMERSV